MFFPIQDQYQDISRDRTITQDTVVSRCSHSIFGVQSQDDVKCSRLSTVFEADATSMTVRAFQTGVQARIGIASVYDLTQIKPP
jgi:hypothetical protein